MLRLAGIQLACAPDKKRNLLRAVELIRLAAAEGAQLACLQELCVTPWFPSGKDAAAFSLAEPVDGETVQTLAEVAAATRLALVCPIFERDGERHFNSAVVLDANGAVLGVYRKVHVPAIPLWEERYYFQLGDGGFPVFHVGGVCIGVQLSWDNFFPEGARALALQGAQVIFAPTAAAYDSQHRWATVISANAIANGCFAFRVNRVGTEGAQNFYGKSFCVDPNGEMIIEPSGAYDAVVLADLDLALIDIVRAEWTLFQDRRIDEYGLLTKIPTPAGLNAPELERPAGAQP